MLCYEVRRQARVLLGLPVTRLAGGEAQCVLVGQAYQGQRVYLGRQDFPPGEGEREDRWRLPQGDFLWSRQGFPILTRAPLPRHFGSALVLISRQDERDDVEVSLLAGPLQSSEPLLAPEDGQSWQSRDGRVQTLAWGWCERPDGSLVPEVLLCLAPLATVRIERRAVPLCQDATLLLSWWYGELRLDVV